MRFSVSRREFSLTLFLLATKGTVKPHLASLWRNPKARLPVRVSVEDQPTSGPHPRVILPMAEFNVGQPPILPHHTDNEGVPDSRGGSFAKPPVC